MNFRGIALSTLTAPIAFAATVAAVSLTSPALAQSDPYAMAHAAAANQLGVMEYCQGRGDVGADAVAAQRSSMAKLPPSTTNNDAEEALGKEGTLAAPNGTKMTLDSLASTHGTSVSAVCKQMGSSAVQAAAAYQQNGMAAGGMAPGGMAMPKMPNGMAMPTMPNGAAMPTMPNTTPPQ